MMHHRLPILQLYWFCDNRDNDEYALIPTEGFTLRDLGEKYAFF